MREIVVISGKGGTGKTSICASLAHLADKAIICDLDVDAPDLHLLLDPQIQRQEPFFSGNEAVINEESCRQCGTCANLCRFEAVTCSQGQYAIDTTRCEGCGVCVSLCPAKAIAFPEKRCGDWYISDTRFGPFVHAQLAPGQENSGRLITLLKQQAYALAKAKGAELVLCDGSPGVGCPVISSLSGASLAVAVVEPTPSGRHDFQRVAALCEHFAIPMAVIINKADLNPREASVIAEFAYEKDASVVGRLPFDPAVTKAMVQRKALTEYPNPLGGSLRVIWDRIRALAFAPHNRHLLTSTF